jgi:two-component system response regulator TctD
MQATLQRSFERRGISVTTCGDGARALDRWRAELPDVVLLDLSLPGRTACRCWPPRAPKAC